MPAPAKGRKYHLYMIMDVDSRKIVGWEVHIDESACLGADVIEKAVRRERLHGKPLVVHSDNGSHMRSNTLLTKLYELGIAPSNSRPRVSDDNPYIESLFKTLKYTPRFPAGGFKCIDTYREFTQKFVKFYNYEHRHKEKTYVTPAQRHEGIDVEILKGRAEVYDATLQENPNRWPNNVRQWKHINSVTLNDQRSTVNGQRSTVKRSLP
jgi:putative transposase